MTCTKLYTEHRASRSQDLTQPYFSYVVTHSTCQTQGVSTSRFHISNTSHILNAGCLFPTFHIFNASHIPNTGVFAPRFYISNRSHTPNTGRLASKLLARTAAAAAGTSAGAAVLFVCYCWAGALQREAGMLQCVAAFQCVAVCCGVLRCVAVCCGVLQCVAVSCIVLQCVSEQSRK